MTPWHLGAMHPFEQALTLILAFGPFLVLGIVIVIRRRTDRLGEERERSDP
jgi:hypothetical protein